MISVTGRGKDALAWELAVPLTRTSRDAGGMSSSRPAHCRAECGVLPDDLYIIPGPWPCIGRPPKYDLSGWAVTLVETCVEPGASATNDRRPEFQRMIEAGTSKPAPVDIVIVHSFSRFFRDHFELEFHVRKLAKNGIKLVSITQEMGDDPMHVMMCQITALFDEYQSKGKRQARPARLEGECPSRLLERLFASHRLPHRRGGAAWGQDQE